jgi:hypothetical protein
MTKREFRKKLDALITDALESDLNKGSPDRGSARGVGAGRNVKGAAAIR